MLAGTASVVSSVPPAVSSSFACVPEPVALAGARANSTRSIGHSWARCRVRMPKFEMTLKATTNPIVKVTEKRTYAFVKNRRGTRRIRFQLWAASAIMARLSIDPRTCKVLEASMRDGRNMTETVPWTRFCGPVMRIGVNCESPPAVRSCVKSRTVLSSTRSALKYSSRC